MNFNYSLINKKFHYLVIEIFFKNVKSFIRSEQSKLILLLIIVCILNYIIPLYGINANNKNIKIALCTMGKNENLYAREFIEYYINLGVEHLFIYDDNDPFTQKIEDILDFKYKDKVSIYNAKQLKLNNQSDAFNNCYENNLKIYSWFIMVDMDEYLYIVNDTLKNYLTKQEFNNCDFIKIHWVVSNDNNLLYYDSRPLFERFPKPYLKSRFIKSIIRGNITNLKYWVHSPFISPDRNVTCDNEGKKIQYKYMNFESIDEINIKKAYLIHFRFKSTEEFINKYKRGYSNWHGNEIGKILKLRLKEYFQQNGITLEKIELIEKELKLNLTKYRNALNSSNNLFSNK